MYVRKGTSADLPAIMNIIKNAQAYLNAQGIDQWQDGYPSKEIIEQDIVAGVGYVACDDGGAVVGYEAVVLTGEEAYNQIESSKWHTSNNYVVVHRLCVLGESRRRGVAIELMNFAGEFALKHDVADFRIDTHEGNVRMLALLNKMGFEHVGTIRYDSGLREAFDLKLNQN